MFLQYSSICDQIPINTDALHKTFTYVFDNRHIREKLNYNIVKL